MNAIPLFSHQIVFTEVDARNATALMDQLGVSAPHLCFYANATLWGHYRFPDSETSLLYLINMFTNGPHAVVYDNESLHKALGAAYYTLLYPLNDTINAQNLHRFASSHIGFIDLVPFSQNNSCNLDPSQYYLFRIEDLYLTKVGKNITSIIEAASPLFKRISPSDFIRNTKLTFVISIHSLTSYIVNILENVSTTFKDSDFVVGFADSQLHDFMNFSVSGSIDEFPCISLLNTTARQYYNIPHSINEKLRNNDETVINDILAFLSNLPFPISISEPLSNIRSDSNVTYLVGSTHDEFIRDNSSNSIILYYSRNTPTTRQFIKVFQATAYIFAQYGLINQIKFGMINTSCNSASFPLMPVQPHIEIYPKYGENWEYFGQANTNSITIFIKDHTDIKIEINTQEPTMKEYNTELLQIYSEYKSFNQKEKRKAEQRLEFLADKLGLNLTQVNEAIHEDLYF